jgi:3-hydroxyacyl-CoA dehydrogenase/enoyl-CoA hydratase/3-hydroxybutyryl-CoA epimerase/enoyl-CoA isomerase
MIFQGKSIQCHDLGDGIVELRFDREGDAINKFDAATVKELGEATQAIAQFDGAKGVVVTSAKDGFIVGADITEFGEAFARPDEEIIQWCADSNAVFSAFEDLPVPTVTAINGVALGGGFEMALSSDYRVMASKAAVGLPEVKLGLFPGFGGTVRLPRLVGADNAIEMIAGGGNVKAKDALANGCTDAVVEADHLLDAAKDLLARANSGELDWKGRRAQKTGPLKLGPIDSMMVFETAKGFVAGKAGKHYPAPIEAINGIQKAAGKGRDEALKIEHKGFAKVAKTTQAAALIGIFMNDQFLKKKSKGWIKQSKEIKQGAVLGAGIMGGGIAYQAASTGTPMIMKDINKAALDLGLNEASKLLGKQVARGKMDAAKMAGVLNNIRDTLNYGDFGEVDIIVEAVVERADIKKLVYADVEKHAREDVIIASNTSSISIDDLAADLKRPENFLGMHFFNPVHRMPLVEVIRGSKTSDEAIAATVALATRMKKTPIVVNNCPGFLVNRILFPYFFGFEGLIAEGADFQRIDKLMEGFGWPMGPSYLNDVVGMDTSQHVGHVLAAGYPDRMSPTEGQKSSLDLMVEAGRLGQKSGSGYYKYEQDRKGKPKKVKDPEAYDIIKPAVQETREHSDEEIIERHMLPMIIETARCLEQGIVDTAPEADMGLIMGIGFPPFRGGALKYADTLGLDNVVKACEKYAYLGKLYEPTDRMKDMAAKGESYYG